MRCQWIARKPELIANLVGLYRGQTTAEDKALGVAWYPTARAIVREWADTYDLPIATVACVMAAISPQCNWERNLVIAADVLSGSAVSIGGALHVNVAKARRILEDKATATLEYFPTGPKVASFALNLAGNDNAITVDGHAAQAAVADVQARFTLPWTPYLIFAECYERAADTVGLAGAEFQAIIWHTWKRKYPWGVKQKLRQQWSVIGEC